MSSIPADRDRRRFRLRPWPTVMTLVGIAVLLALGTWQVRRLAWKEALIADIDRQITAPVVELQPGTDPAGLNFRHVTARGTYLHGAAFAVVAGPVFITLLLLFVSGVPLLERSADEKYGCDPAYRDYKRRTSILVPLPPRT